MRIERLEKRDLQGFEIKKYKRTELSKLITENWILSGEELAKQSKVGYDNIVKALNGERIPTAAEIKLREFFKNRRG